MGKALAVALVDIDDLVAVDLVGVLVADLEVDLGAGDLEDLAEVEDDQFYSLVDHQAEALPVDQDQEAVPSEAVQVEEVEVEVVAK